MRIDQYDLPFRSRFDEAYLPIPIGSMIRALVANGVRKDRDVVSSIGRMNPRSQSTVLYLPLKPRLDETCPPILIG